MKLLIGMTDAGETIGRLARRSPGAHIVSAGSEREFREIVGADYDGIALHAGLFAAMYPWDWMSDVRLANPRAKVAIVLSESVYSSVLTDVVLELAERMAFAVVPQGMTAEEGMMKALDILGTEPPSTEGEIRQEADEAAYSGEAYGGLGLGGSSEHKERPGRLVTILSCSPKDGATTIAAGTALCLAERTKLKIGLLDLNLKCPDLRDCLNVNARSRNLLSIRPLCGIQTLTGAQLLEHCIVYRGQGHLRLLLGTHRRDTSGDVTPEQIDHLLDAAKDAFDLVIADVHTFPDNAATVRSVLQADECWLVAQPAHASYRVSWSDWRK